MESVWKTVIILSVCLEFLYTVICENQLVVHTKSGPVKGVLSKDDKGTVYQFLKIPFAKPPVGNLRFRKPLPVDPWDDVIDATEHPPSCMQLIHEDFSNILPVSDISEDCLYLNIYVPNELSSGNKKTVMVWIHGGAYHFGQASMYDGSFLALTGDVIVVTINYRLNVFGFLSTWDSAALGNYGLWDQILALQWVKDNIEAFSGNPQSITIFGESAGGCSVSFLSLIPSTKGLFNRVIAQSGTSNSPLADNNKFKSYIRLIIEEVDCNDNQNDTESVVECLRQVPAEDFLTASDKAIYGGMTKDFVIPVSPRIDNDLITDFSNNLFENLESPSRIFFRSLDYMAGFTSAEGVDVFLAGQTSNPEQHFNATAGISKDLLCNIFAQKMSKSFYSNLSEVTEAMCKMYSVENGDYINKIKQAESAIDLNGDFISYAPVIKSLNTHTKINKLRHTYKFVFSRPLNFSFMGSTFPHWFQRAPHGSELPYLFGIDNFGKLAKHTFTEEDHRLADVMMKYWTNFAKTGNPNAESLPYWPVYTEDKMEFINLNLGTRHEAASANFKKRMKLWLEDIPDIIKRTQPSSREEL